MEKRISNQSHVELARVGITAFFLLVVLAYSFWVSGAQPNISFLAVAAVFGAYMAMNIGANDVANNMGLVVGAKVLTLGSAILIAMICEAGGAFIAGGDVVTTIKKDIIDIHAFDGQISPFLWVMMAALLAAALWLNIATLAKAPVSTTHAIVGGVMGAGIAASGFGIVNWVTMGEIAVSWVISPVIGGVIAAIILYTIKQTIVFKQNKVDAAYQWVPVYVAVMAFAFTIYLVIKGFKHVWQPMIMWLNTTLSFSISVAADTRMAIAVIAGAGVAAATFLRVRQTIGIKIEGLSNERHSINQLFTIPLALAAALLSFAHGANDVANAVGPLAAINEAVLTGGIATQAGIPFWVMAVGAAGIAIGLALYGPRLIRTVGSEITDLDPIRAFSIAMAAAITVIVASQFGLPVSSTHIAVGGVFGVGFLREWMVHANTYQQAVAREKKKLEEAKQRLYALRRELQVLDEKIHKTEQDFERMSVIFQTIDAEEARAKKEKKHLKKEKKQRYVQRDAVKKIVTAWIITVPSAAVIAAALFFMIKGVML